jgi:hypothetical protein
VHAYSLTAQLIPNIWKRAAAGKSKSRKKKLKKTTGWHENCDQETTCRLKKIEKIPGGLGGVHMELAD